MHGVTRPYQFWTNISDLYVSWSKVSVGLTIHKNDKKKLNQVLFDASSFVSIFMETTKKEKNAKSQQPKKLEHFFNEPELCSYFACDTFYLIILCFLRYFKISWWF